MALNINTNIGALGAAAAATSVNKSMETAMERLSTGKRVNTAADDAAGVAIASRLTSEIRGTNMAIRNAMDAQALIDTAEGAHNEITNILQRMRELAVQSANDTNAQTDRNNLQAEVDQLVSEIDRIANVTSWAGEGLIDTANTFKFQIGARGTANNSSNELSVTMNAMTSAALSVGAGNAAVGANGATLTEIGENVLQVGGTPVAGDTYKYSLNGTNFQVKLIADGSNFDYQVSTDNGTTFGATVTSHSQANGATSAAVADIIAHQVNALTDHPGLTASANSDGSVTFTQNITITGGYDTTGTPVDIAVQGSDTSSVVLAGSNTTSTFLADKTYKIAGELAWGDSKVTTFTVNGTDEISVTGTALATAGYAKTAVGAANYIADQLNAKTDLKGLSFRVGSLNNDAYIEITQSSTALLANELATAAASSNAISISSQANASASIATIDTAITTVNTQRANLGAVSNRLDSTVSNMTNIVTNLEAGRSRIVDADFAAESTSLAKSQILQQASMAMLAQANASKQGVLQLLQG